MAATAIAALVTAGLTPAAAQAVPTWLPPTPVSSEGTPIIEPAVAADAAGNSVVLWARGESGGGYRIEAATRAAGGTWSSAVALDYSFDIGRFDVAFDGSGVATAVWTTDSDVAGKTVVRAARLPSPDAVWTAPKTISDVDTIAFSPQVAANAAGDTTVAWTAASGTLEVHAVYRPAGGGWGDAETLSTTGQEALDPDLVIDRAGTATAAWWVNGVTTVVQSSTRPASGEWSEPDQVSSEGVNGRLPQLAATPSGMVTAVWESRADGKANIASADRAGSQAWSEPVIISACHDCYTPRLAMNAEGQAVAGWDDEGGTASAQAARRASDGTWSQPVTLDGPGVPGSGAYVAIDPRGTATAVWVRGNGSPDALAYARQPLGGAWTSPAVLSSDIDSAPALASDGDGDAVAAWAIGESDAKIQVAGLDAAGPRVVAFASPSSAGVGKGLNFSAEATDDWSSVASYSWAFGDGTSATGPWVSHAFASAGTYDVTLTVTDTVGNTTTRTTPVTVTAAVPLPVPLAPPELTRFKLVDRKIKALSRAASVTAKTKLSTKTKLRIGLTASAKVRLVVRSKHRHLVRGELRFVKVTLTRSRPGGPSVITLRNRLATIKLPADTYRIVGTATNKAGTSAKKKARLVVVDDGHSVG